MERVNIAEFSKVSFDRYFEDYKDKVDMSASEKEVREIWESIKLPRRATRGAAGYDFFSPVTFSMNRGSTITIPTGIRCKIKEGWVLMVFPRSGYGFKYRMQLDNTVGIIDEDYFYSDNEGHIFVKITNDSKREKTLSCSRGVGFAQGVFLPYGLTIGDSVTEKRTGGLGSTGM